MKEPARTLLEALLVGAVALGAGLAANAVNPDGLSLTRDHFHTATPLPEPAPAAATAPAAPLPHAAPTAPATQATTDAQVAPGLAAAQAAQAATDAQVAPAVTAAQALAAAQAVTDAPAAQSAPGGQAADASGAPDPVTEAVSARLREHGLAVLTHAEARALFEDPAYAAGAYVFVDARGDDAYRAGHVPGAVQFDRYHPERHVADVTAACAGALSVIVYCVGKNCEDSELAAQDLPALGIDSRLIHVYVGGFTEWSAQGMPVEQGARGGGGG